MQVLYDAASRMLRNAVGRLPVVERANSSKLIGYLGRAEILNARLRQLHDEHVRDVGWMSGWRRKDKRAA